MKIQKNLCYALIVTQKFLYVKCFFEKNFGNVQVTYGAA